MEREQERLRIANEKAKKELEDVPKGTLRLGKSQGCVQYYHCLPGGPHNGTYLPKSKMELVKQLAQKTYNERVCQLTGRRLSQIGRILKDYKENEIEACYLCEHPERQKLITPVEMTRQQKLELWMSQPFVGKGFREDALTILTNNGLRVRSKSEKIMADYFDACGIRYKYECPLSLRPYGIVYPDFTFLSETTGQEIYWEHEGMMDNPEYARAAVKKIELYEKNGIFPGERLILTFETAASSINTAILKDMTEKYLLTATRR